MATPRRETYEIAFPKRWIVRNRDLPHPNCDGDIIFIFIYLFPNKKYNKFDWDGKIAFFKIVILLFLT